MKKTPLYEKHVALGAQIVPFAGYEMPIQYTSILDEHKTVRENAGLFDVSHMGEIEIKGPEAVALTDQIMSNSVADMKPGTAEYTVMCKEDGGIIDDLFIHYVSKDHIFLVVNASNADKDFAWIKSHERPGAQVTNLSDQYAEIALQGPKAEDIIRKVAEFPAWDLPYFHFGYGKVAGREVMVARTGYTGEDGFEIYTSNQDAPYIWDELLRVGKEFGIKPIGLGARDTLRFEVCYWLYGNELDETINPLEAGQKFVVKFEKDFIGKAALLKAEADGIKRKLVCLKMLEEGGIPRSHFKVFDGSTEIGFVTSGGMLPTAGYVGAMAYVPTTYKVGTKVSVEIRGRKLAAEIIKKPFYKGTSGKKRE
ncbi:MAG: glycine cleavage system aminomethyltransferase GcvT [Caldisericia bacterium]|nr:glycine cleavage system aminomethyltransferase GcvT [Caldisericia bacterium]